MNSSMMNSKELTALFFTELKKYNATNFKTLQNADLTQDDPVVKKCFSAVITRYFIFREKHPEISEPEFNMLYFKLKLDLIAQYFAEYPDTSTDNLVAFQIELNNYIKEYRGELQNV